MKDDDSDDISEDNILKTKLEIDDEDAADLLKLTSTKDDKIKEDSLIKIIPPSSPIIRPKEPPKHSTLENSYLHLFSKHSRSSESDSDSSSSDEDFPRKKKLKQLSEFQKSFTQSQKENFEKKYNILKEDFKFLEEYEIKIFKDTNLDIMFIMDLTGSMGIWLNEAKKNVKKIIEEIYDNNPGSKIRMSFIGYRDYIDAKEARKYDNQQFTENITEFNNFLSKLDCSGGGDEPEDVVGALGQALNMNWESNAKYAVLVADAPCHGKDYHNISYDKFPDGDPTGIKLEDLVKQFYEKGITFYCIEINNNTKKMFNIMKNIYNDREKFHIEKLGNSVDQFSFFVTFSASVLLGNEKYRKMNFNEILKNYRDETINKIMSKYLNNNINNILTNNNDMSLTSQLINQIENLNLGTEDKKLFEFINRMSDLNINKENTNNKNNENEKKNNNINNDYIAINIDEENIKKMESKIINCNIFILYYNKNSNNVHDWTNPTCLEKKFRTNIQLSVNSFKTNLEKKEYEIYFVDNILSKEKLGKIPFMINKKDYNDPLEYIKKIAYEDLICEQIADYFNILLNTNLPNLKQFIKFQRHILYEIDIGNNNSNNMEEEFYLNTKYIISEDSIAIQLDTSVPPTKRVFQNFSHFSYQISGGQFLISDINYDKELKKVTEYKIYHSKGEGYKKILEFFSGHICDNTCNLLGLAHPRKKLNPINVDDNFFADRYLIDINLCECCSCPVNIKDYNKENKFCGFCSWKEAQSKKRGVCSQCKLPFFISTYIYNSQFINYPTTCQNCSKTFNTNFK